MLQLNWKLFIFHKRKAQYEVILFGLLYNLLQRKYVVYGTRDFLKTGLFTTLEVVKFAFETIRNNSREQLIYMTQKGDLWIFSWLLWTFLKKSTTTLLNHASGGFALNRTKLNIFWRTFKIGLPPTYKSLDVILSSAGALLYLSCLRAILMSCIRNILGVVSG